jgi:VanZ family protein
MEWAQMAVPGRTCSLMDALLNAAGVGIGIPILWYAQRRLDGRCGCPTQSP